MYKSRIAGIGANVPENVVSNFDLEKYMDTSNEWIIERTGIRERRFVTQPTGTSELSLPACLEAFDDAVKKKKVKRGDNVILAAFGSGFT